LSQWIELLTTKLIWAYFRVYLPIFHYNIPVGTFCALFFVCEMMTGYWLAFNFQVSHVSSYCDYPIGDAKDANAKTIPDEWAVSQVKACVDYSHTSPLMTFLCGALNYQVVHHLFPVVSQYHYPQIAPIVKQVCDEYKVKYIILPDFPTAFGGHLRHLKNLGEKGYSAEMPHMG
jgi:fatty acid desaturase